MIGSKFFFTTMAFFFLLWGISAVSAESKVPPAVQEEIASLDRQIVELEAMKRGFDARALRHEDQALTLQFDQGRNLEMRRHLEFAEENREKAAAVQVQIDRLKEKRQKLIDKYGE